MSSLKDNFEVERAKMRASFRRKLDQAQATRAHSLSFDDAEMTHIGSREGGSSREGSKGSDGSGDGSGGNRDRSNSDIGVGGGGVSGGFVDRNRMASKLEDMEKSLSRANAAQLAAEGRLKNASTAHRKKEKEWGKEKDSLVQTVEELERALGLGGMVTSIGSGGNTSDEGSGNNGNNIKVELPVIPPNASKGTQSLFLQIKSQQQNLQKEKSDFETHKKTIEKENEGMKREKITLEAKVKLMNEVGTQLKNDMKQELARVQETCAVELRNCEKKLKADAAVEKRRLEDEAMGLTAQLERERKEMVVLEGRCREAVLKCREALGEA